MEDIIFAFCEYESHVGLQRLCSITKKWHEVVLTNFEYNLWLKGTPIQNISRLSQEEKEFLKTGRTPAEQKRFWSNIN